MYSLHFYVSIGQKRSKKFKKTKRSTYDKLEVNVSFINDASATVKMQWIHLPFLRKISERIDSSSFIALSLSFSLSVSLSSCHGLNQNTRNISSMHHTLKKYNQHRRRNKKQFPIPLSLASPGSITIFQLGIEPKFSSVLAAVRFPSRNATTPPQEANPFYETSKHSRG